MEKPSENPIEYFLNLSQRDLPRWVLLLFSYTITDGLGPEKSGQGRARALKSQARAGPGLEPFHECRAPGLDGPR